MKIDLTVCQQSPLVVKDVNYSSCNRKVTFEDVHGSAITLRPLPVQVTYIDPLTTVHVSTAKTLIQAFMSMPRYKNHLPPSSKIPQSQF